MECLIPTTVGVIHDNDDAMNVVRHDNPRVQLDMAEMAQAEDSLRDLEGDDEQARIGEGRRIRPGSRVLD